MAGRPVRLEDATVENLLDPLRHALVIDPNGDEDQLRAYFRDIAIAQAELDAIDAPGPPGAAAFDPSWPDERPP